MQEALGLEMKQFPEYGLRLILLRADRALNNKLTVRCVGQEALDLEVKQFPEYGLRLILTFRPSTNFLVPLDRCIHLARKAFSADGAQSGLFDTALLWSTLLCYALLCLCGMAASWSMAARGKLIVSVSQAANFFIGPQTQHSFSQPSLLCQPPCCMQWNIFHLRYLSQQ